MRKLLTLSFNAILILLTSLFSGCENQIKKNDFIPKTNEEYMESLLNTTIEMELIIEEKRATCYYSNNSDIFVFIIKGQYSSPSGYVYSKSEKTVYYYDGEKLIVTKTNVSFDEHIKNVHSETNFLFHLEFKDEPFEYKKTVTVCNRECDKFRFKTTIRNKDLTFNIYIDKETGFCLKAVCSYDDSTDIYFETKKFIQSSDLEFFINLINKCKKENNTQ